MFVSLKSQFFSVLVGISSHLEENIQLFGTIFHEKNP